MSRQYPGDGQCGDCNMILPEGRTYFCPKCDPEGDIPSAAERTGDYIADLRSALAAMTDERDTYRSRLLRDGEDHAKAMGQLADMFAKEKREHATLQAAYDKVHPAWIAAGDERDRLRAVLGEIAQGAKWLIPMTGGGTKTVAYLQSIVDRWNALRAPQAGREGT